MRVKLGDIYQITSGGTPKKGNPEYFENGSIPWIKTGDLKGKNIESYETITESGLQNSSAKLFPENTVLLAMYGATIGNCAILDFEASTNQACAAFLPNDLVLPEYLYYFLLGKKKQFIKDGVGGAQPNISATYLKKVNFELISIEEQIRIVSVLDKLSGIIDNRAKQLQTLDELIKARFVEMFESEEYVETDLINLIVNGAGLSYGIVQPGDDGTGNMGVLRPVDIVDGKIITKNIKYINRSIGDGYKKTELKGNELLITVRGTTGITALTDSRLNGMNVTRGIAVIRYDIDKINPVYLNTFLKSDESQRYIQEHTRGATLKQINLSDLKVLKIKVPSSKQQNEFADFVQEVDKSKVVVQKALDEAQLLFDSLMQQYFG